MNSSIADERPPDIPPEKPSIFRQHRNTFILWAAIIAAMLILLSFHVDKKVIAIFTITLGLLTKAFAGLGALIALIPVAGPLIVKLFALPFFWIVNGLAYLVSLIAIKQGYSKEVIKSRVLAIAVLIGILIGYILGHLLPIR